MEIPPQLKDFKNFLFLAWKQLNLPDPTDLQYDIAGYMDGDERRAIIQAFRGCGKSWICSAYVVHQLLLNPALNILVVSASKTRSDDFSTFTLRLINEMPILQHLRPKDNQRQSKISFDVGPAPASHAPSVKSLGITSQLTGSRADIIIADDIEVANNSATQLMREKLSEQVKEFDAIIKPEKSSKILFLGTPQTEDSIYSKLQERGYKARVWPSEYITPNTNERTYNGTVAAFCVDGDKKGKATEPLRFSEIDLGERKISYGSCSNQVYYGAIDTFCTNGMITGDYDKVRRKNSSNFSMDRFIDELKNSRRDFDTQMDKFQQWAFSPIGKFDIKAMLDSLMGSESKSEKMFGLYKQEVSKRGKTVFALYSAFTNYASYADERNGFRMRNTGNDTQAQTMWLREQEVAKWIASPQFKQLEAA